MKDLARRLKELGLEQYAQAFADNEVNFEILPALTNEDFKELGLSLGRRRKILIERWRHHYSTVRPHSAQGYRPQMIAMTNALETKCVTLSALCSCNGVCENE